MRIKAKVNQFAVKSYEDAVKDMSNYIPFLENGRVCLEELYSYLTGLQQECTKCTNALEEASGKLAKKIAQIENDIERVEAEISRLQEQVDCIEAEMANTPSSYTIVDSETGESREVANPAYIALEIQLAKVQSELGPLEVELEKLQQRLNHAERVSSQIESKIAEINGVIASLEEKKFNCRTLVQTIVDIKVTSIRKCESAKRILEKINILVDEYRTIKMLVENTLAYNKDVELTVDSLLKININVTQNNIYKEHDGQDDKQRTNSNQEIFLDDNGVIYRVGNELAANATFQVNGYTYKTDNQGRTISASGKLELNEMGQKNRKMDDHITVVGQGDERVTDDRGHLIGHQFNGSDRMENLVPQNDMINRNDFRFLEERLAKLVRLGKAVTVNVVPVFNQESRRPEGIFYFYVVEGVSHVVLFPNEIKEDLQ